jgi:hypothetical protein
LSINVAGADLGPVQCERSAGGHSRSLAEVLVDLAPRPPGGCIMPGLTRHMRQKSTLRIAASTSSTLVRSRFLVGRFLWLPNIFRCHIFCGDPVVSRRGHGIWEDLAARSLTWACGMRHAGHVSSTDRLLILTRCSLMALRRVRMRMGCSAIVQAPEAPRRDREVRPAHYSATGSIHAKLIYGSRSCHSVVAATTRKLP